MKNFIALSLCLALTLALCACANNTPPAGSEESAASSPEKTASQPTVEPTPEPTLEPTPEPLSPYNWLGYPEVPQCAYLDLLCSGHYYQEYTTYLESGDSVKELQYTEAVDGGNSCKLGAAIQNYSFEGAYYEIDEKKKTYRIQDTNVKVPTVLEKAAENVNKTGQVFQGTGKGAIPIYEAFDSAQYDYYEYLIETKSVSIVDRVYMKNGDVYALYSYTKTAKNSTASTKVITLMTGDIPAGIFDLPDLSGYTEK